MRHSTSAKFKMSRAKKKIYEGEGNPMWGKKHSDEAKRAVSASRKDTVWITNEARSRLVKRSELEDWVMAGWTRGRTTKK